MFPFFEVFGVRVSMMAIGVLLSVIVFMFSIWYLCKKYHQDFMKIGYKIPFWLVLTYILSRYFAVALATKDWLPSSWIEIMNIFRLDHFNLHRVGILLSVFICLSVFFSGVKRIENKRIWIDILFSAFCNGIMLLGLFLVLWDTVIGSSTQSIFAVRALREGSWLNKFYGVYPVGLFLSLGTLIVNIVVNVWRILAKKSWRWLRGMLALLVVINICFLFQYYPRYWLVNILWISLDIKQYSSLFVFAIWCITAVRWNWRKKG